MLHEQTKLSLATLPARDNAIIKHPLVFTRGKYSVGVFHGCKFPDQKTLLRLRLVGFKPLKLVCGSRHKILKNVLKADNIIVDNIGKYSVILEYDAANLRLNRITIYKPVDLMQPDNYICINHAKALVSFLQHQFNTAPNAKIEADVDTFKVPGGAEYFDFGTAQVRPYPTAFAGVDWCPTALYLQTLWAQANGCSPIQSIETYRFSKAIEIRFIY